MIILRVQTVFTFISLLTLCLISIIKVNKSDWQLPSSKMVTKNVLSRKYKVNFNEKRKLSMNIQDNKHLQEIKTFLIRTSGHDKRNISKLSQVFVVTHTKKRSICQINNNIIYISDFNILI